jgi:hypothetical protein
MDEMEYRDLLALPRVGAAALIAMTACLAPAAAGQICVDCAEPAATYRCLFADDELAALKLPQTAAQVVCMTELAKQGGHRFCRVSQSQTAGICSGQDRIVGLNARGTGIATTTPPADAGAAPADIKPPPATLSDLAKETAKSSGDGLKAAGNAIKSGAEKVGDGVGHAVDCVISLFKRC